MSWADQALTADGTIKAQNLTKSRIKKSRKRAMLRGVDAMLDLIDDMLAPVKERMHDAVIMKSISQPLELMWPVRFETRCNPFAKVGA